MEESKLDSDSVISHVEADLRRRYSDNIPKKETNTPPTAHPSNCGKHQRSRITKKRTSNGSENIRNKEETKTCIPVDTKEAPSALLSTIASPTRFRDAGDADTGAKTAADVNERIESILSYVKKKADETNDVTRRFTERSKIVAQNKPEVHFIGEIVGGSAFFDGKRTVGLSCQWSVSSESSAWTHLEGETSGRSQYASAFRDDGVVPWNHPLDVHFTTAAVQGWPRLSFKIWKLDRYDRASLAGYGWCHLPTCAGRHHAIFLYNYYIERLKSFWI
mmetsp:Transcript_16898/g.38020  ORF Transcript_16898/g.38020 Transcript_16898/m.38020 type:complete len:276 (-) Transcript_16898:472-1299(-)